MENENRVQKKIRIDGLMWWIYEDKNKIRHPQPICPVHHLRMYPTYLNNFGNSTTYNESRSLKCADCKTSYGLSRTFSAEKQYIIDRIDAKVFKGMKVINLDDEAIPLAEIKLSSKDKKYFATGLITKSKVGLRLVIYAGERGKKEKTQIFVEPEIKRLSFDQSDLHPVDVFTKIEATFKDKTKSAIRKNKNR